jgi:hypothetical protein
MLTQSGAAGSVGHISRHRPAATLRLHLRLTRSKLPGIEKHLVSRSPDHPRSELSRRLHIIADVLALARFYNHSSRAKQKYSGLRRL